MKAVPAALSAGAAAEADAERARWLQRLDKQCNVQLCDFGAALWVDKVDEERGRDTHYVQTPWYRAPEIPLGDTRFHYSIGRLERRGHDLGARAGHPRFSRGDSVRHIVQDQRTEGHLPIQNATSPVSR